MAKKPRYKQPKKFHTIVLHFRPHFDEIVALWLLLIFNEEAENIFPGITTAGITFVDAGTIYHSPPANALEEQGYLCIGVGGGRFDEHPTSFDVRKNGECAATLIASILGVAKDPQLKELLDYVRRIDLEGKAGVFELPSLIKLLQLQAETEDEMRDVIAWAYTALDAWWRSRQSRHATHKEKMIEVVETAFAEWLLKFYGTQNPSAILRENRDNRKSLAHFVAERHGFFDDPRFKQLLEYLERSVRGGFHPFGLGKILYLLSEQFSSPTSQSTSWAERALDGKLQEQIDFLDALDELNHAENEKIGGGGVGLLLVIAHSDNYQLSKAVRYLYKERLGIFIQVRTSGHVQIFVNYLSHQQLHSAPLAHHIRLAEQRCRGQIFTHNPRKACG